MCGFKKLNRLHPEEKMSVNIHLIIKLKDKIRKATRRKSGGELPFTGSRVCHQHPLETKRKWLRSFEVLKEKLQMYLFLPFFFLFSPLFSFSFLFFPLFGFLHISLFLNLASNSHSLAWHLDPKNLMIPAVQKEVWFPPNIWDKQEWIIVFRS